MTQWLLPPFQRWSLSSITTKMQAKLAPQSLTCGTHMLCPMMVDMGALGNFRHAAI